MPAITELDQEFARTYYALTKYHYLETLESWARKETIIVGKELKTAAAYMAEVLKHRRGEVETDIRTVIESTRLLAGKIADGAG